VRAKYPAHNHPLKLENPPKNLIFMTLERTSSKI